MFFMVLFIHGRRESIPTSLMKRKSNDYFIHEQLFIGGDVQKWAILCNLPRFIQ